MDNPFVFILGVAAFFGLGAALLGAPGPWLAIGVIAAVLFVLVAGIQHAIRNR